MPKEKDAADLGTELFSLVETDQGYAYFSDGTPPTMPREVFFQNVRNSLRHAERAAALIRKFLVKYGEI